MSIVTYSQSYVLIFGPIVNVPNPGAVYFVWKI